MSKFSSFIISFIFFLFSPPLFTFGNDSQTSSDFSPENDGAKLLEILEKSDNRGLSVSGEGDEKKNQLQEFSYSKNDGNLRRFFYNGEHFTVWKEGKNTMAVNYYGEKLTRKTYDEFFRLRKSENYKMGKTTKDMILESIGNYEYRDDTSILLESIQDFIPSKKQKKFLYDDKGRCISILESHYSEDGKKIINDKKTVKVYDSEGRVLEENIFSWIYKNNSLGQSLVEESSIKNSYDYKLVNTGKVKNPDYFLYENGELHLARNYTENESYSEEMYFDKGFSVKVFYNNGKKTEEIIYLNGVEQRRRNFEY